MAQWQATDEMRLMDEEDDEADLQEALALSMRTYQAEQSGQGQALLLPSEWHAPAACRHCCGIMDAVNTARVTHITTSNHRLLLVWHLLWLLLICADVYSVCFLARASRIDVHPSGCTRAELQW
jgi:hypothetical protein